MAHRGQVVVVRLVPDHLVSVLLEELDFLVIDPILASGLLIEIVTDEYFHDTPSVVPAGAQSGCSFSAGSHGPHGQTSTTAALNLRSASAPASIGSYRPGVS